MGLAHMQDPKHLSLTVNQVQDDVNLTNMSDSKNLNLVVNQIQSNDHPPLAYLGE
jgi:hypothetical protein